MGLYVIYDVLAEESGPVFQANNDNVAVRAYGELTKDMGNVEKTTFVLYYVGEFDEHSMLISHNEPRKVVNE